MSFLYLCDISKYSKSQFEKMTSSTDTFFFGCMFFNRYIILKFGMRYVQTQFYNILYVFFLNFENFGFLEFLDIFWKIRDSHFKELFILRLVVHFICIFQKIFFFGDLSNIQKFSPKNGMTMGHLNRYNSKKKSRKLSKIVCEDVKLLYKEVC